MFNSSLSFALLMAACTSLSIRSPKIVSGVGLTQLSNTNTRNTHSALLAFTAVFVCIENSENTKVPSANLSVRFLERYVFE